MTIELYYTIMQVNYIFRLMNYITIWKLNEKRKENTTKYKSRHIYKLY